MTELKPIPDSDLPAYVDIAARAYPGMHLDSAEARTRLVERLQAMPDGGMCYGAYRDSEIRGGMILFDFTMQCFEAQVPVGGVGMVAVDLLHKKEKIARDMLQFYLAHYAKQGAPLAALYPFRPDFYKKMGFGYGTRKYQYRVPPEALPRGESKAHVRYLRPDDVDALRDCYARLMARTHGLMTRRARALGPEILENPKAVVIGVDINGTLDGYAILTFEPEPGRDFLTNNIVVRDFVYHSPAALSELFTFLHTQADQIYRVIFNTQDEYFHHLLLDPRNHTYNMIPSVYHESHTAGVGIMYRVLDVAGLFRALADHDFGGVSLTLAIDLADSFYPANQGRHVIRFADGRATPLPDGPADVTIALDVADFSSLILGVLPFSYLHAHGLATLSDHTRLAEVDRLFRAAVKPVCMTDF